MKDWKALEKSQQRNKRYKKRTIENFRTRVKNNENRKLSGWAHSVMEAAKERFNELEDSTI